MNADKSRIAPWQIPLLYVGVAVVCGLVLPHRVHAYLSAYSHTMSVASARSCPPSPPA